MSKIKRSASLHVSKANKENVPTSKSSLNQNNKSKSNKNALLNSSSLNLSISDCTCPICLEILFEPVHMPCNHEVCLPCFKTMTDKTNFLCPMCRMRISTWSRAASNTNTLVNQTRWSQIKRMFPQEIKDRIEGKTASLLAESIEREKKREAEINESKKTTCSEPGAIRQEYQDYLSRERERARIEREKEEKLNLEYIQKLIREEESLTYEEYIRAIEPTVSVVEQAQNSQNRTQTADRPSTSSSSSSSSSSTSTTTTAATSIHTRRLAKSTSSRSTLNHLNSTIGSSISNQQSENDSNELTPAANSIKLRLRPSIKRSRDQIRPLRGTAMHNLTATSVINSSSSNLDTSSIASQRASTAETPNLSALATLPRRRNSVRVRPTYK